MIQKNPNLCYADTIDWGDRIGPSGKNHHLIKVMKSTMYTYSMRTTWFTLYIFLLYVEQ